MTDYAAVPVPTRTLTLHARKQPFIASSWVAPVVLLDGHRFPLRWGTQQLVIPADRPVHVQCEMPWIFTYGRAAAIVQPNNIAELEYSPPSSQWFAGEIGAPGTTQTRGTWLVWLVLALVVFFVGGGLLLSFVSLGLSASDF